MTQYRKLCSKMEMVIDREISMNEANQAKTNKVQNEVLASHKLLNHGYE